MIWAIRQKKRKVKKSQAIAYSAFSGSGLIARCIEGVMIPGLNY